MENNTIYLAYLIKKVSNAENYWLLIYIIIVRSDIA